MQVNKGTDRRSSCCRELERWLSPKLFKALSDPTRLSLLVRMAQAREPCTVGVVADGSGIDLSVVSRHLAILREAGIIRCEKRGKELHCVVDTEAVVRTLRSLADALEQCCPKVVCATPGCDDAEVKRTAAPKKRPPR